MHPMIVTTTATGILGLIFIVLSARVVLGRTSTKTLLGHGENDASPLFIAVRSHANFAEYVPLCLLLIAALEVQHGASLLVKVLAAILILARIAHPIGMATPGPNPFRAGGFVGTILVLAVGSVAAVATVFL